MIKINFLDESELKRQLQSLACGKVPILIKSSKGVEIHSDDEFTFNKEFKHKLCRIKINQVQLKETVTIILLMFFFCILLKLKIILLYLARRKSIN